MMKNSFAIIGIVAVFGFSAYFYYSNQQPVAPAIGISSGIQSLSQINASDKPDSSTQIQHEDVIQDSLALPQQTRTEQQEKDLLRQQSMQATAVREEIDELIVELDENLSDPSQRKALKQRISNKMAEYNQHVLPVAINAMQDRQQ